MIQETKDLVAKEQIEELHQTHPAYGHRRVALALGWSRNRARRIMVKYDIRPPRRKCRKIRLTRSVDNHRYTNLIKGIHPTKPGQIFVSDLTYLKYQSRQIYLATVEDIFTREVVAAEMSDHHDSRLALRTIHQAINRRYPPEIFHSDRGSEFMAQTVTGFLEGAGVRVSVSDKGSPWQNGYEESFFGRFKEENGDLGRFDGLGELIEEIYAYVHYYNNSRIHTRLKMPPKLFKKKYTDSVSQKSGT